MRQRLQLEPGPPSSCPHLSVIVFPRTPQPSVVSPGLAPRPLNAHRAGSRRWAPEAVPGAPWRLGAAGPTPAPGTQLSLPLSLALSLPASLPPSLLPFFDFFFFFPPFFFGSTNMPSLSSLSSSSGPSSPPPAPRPGQGPAPHLWAPSSIKHIENCILGLCWYKYKCNNQP